MFDQLQTSGFDGAVRLANANRSGIAAELAHVDKRHLNAVDVLFRGLNDSIDGILIESLRLAGQPLQFWR